jgi:hypothetical protein
VTETELGAEQPAIDTKIKPLTARANSRAVTNLVFHILILLGLSRPHGRARFYGEHPEVTMEFSA